MKIVRNSDYYQHKEEYSVRCLKYKQDATLTIFYSSVQMCKSDIQLTPIELGRKCSLWEENKFTCIECPYLQK